MCCTETNGRLFVTICFPSEIIKVYHERIIAIKRNYDVDESTIVRRAILSAVTCLTMYKKNPRTPEYRTNYVQKKNREFFSRSHFYRSKFV